MKKTIVFLLAIIAIALLYLVGFWQFIFTGIGALGILAFSLTQYIGPAIFMVFFIAILIGIILGTTYGLDKIWKIFFHKTLSTNANHVLTIIIASLILIVPMFLSSYKNW